MSRAWMRYLGFLGLLGLLGLVTGNPGFYGFFGFFGFFAFRPEADDERLQINIGKSGRNAFVASVLAFALFATWMALVPGATVETYAYGVALLFALQLLVFTLSLVYYER